MQDGGVEAFGHSVCVVENIALLIGDPAEEAHTTVSKLTLVHC